MVSQISQSASRMVTSGSKTHHFNGVGFPSRCGVKMSLRPAAACGVVCTRAVLLM
jgi:hypothetical protein